jgi:hypothetical protein
MAVSIHSGSSSDFLADLSRGQVPKGIHKTETIVPDGTRLTVVGHLAEYAIFAHPLLLLLSTIQDDDRLYFMHNCDIIVAQVVLN